MFTVRRGVNFHFFRFEELTPKIAWRVACDVGVGCLFWKGKKIRGTFKEEEKYRGESIMVSASSVSSVRRARAGGHLVSVLSLYLYISYVPTTYVCSELYVCGM